MRRRGGWADPRSRSSPLPGQRLRFGARQHARHVRAMAHQDQEREQFHGYNFEVPATAEVGLCEPVPLKAMGRFNHEAVAVDPASGIVYQTEDRDDGLLTRFIPKEPGNLKAGGVLQALVVKGRKSCDTRNWPSTGAEKIPLGEPLEVEWSG